MNVALRNSGGGRSGRERGLGIHFWVECKTNKERRV